VLTDGEKVQFGGSLEYRYAAPGRLRASIRTYYGSVGMTGKVCEVMTGLARRYPPR
jgi:hypothetical protein